MRGWAVVVEGGFAREDDETLLAFIIAGIEMQRHVWILLNMFNFVGFCLTENENRIILPEKPDRSGLGRARGLQEGRPFLSAGSGSR